MTTPSWQPKKILLIEDEQSVLFALKLLLGALGFEVSPFGAGAEALEFAKEHPELELCLCDLRMPKLNGLQVLAQMRLLRPDLPVILMSAHADDDEQERAKTLGVASFLSKPFTPEELQSCIQTIGNARLAATKIG